MKEWKKLNKTKQKEEEKCTMYSMNFECISSQERLSIFYEPTERPTDRTNKLFHEIYVIPFCRFADIAKR